MIETSESIDKIESILATPGLCGIFIGPNDLSISISKGERVDPNHSSVLAAIDEILLFSLKHNKIAGIFAGTADTAREYAKRGFQFIAMGSDLGYLRSGAARALAKAKGGIAEVKAGNWF